MRIRLLKIISIIILSSSLNGCFIGAIAAGVGVAKWGAAKKKEAQAKNKEAYNQYLNEMDKNNSLRARAGLPPQPVLTFQEYVNS